MKYRNVLLASVLVITGAILGEAAAATSELTFESSNKTLQNAFAWAKSQALAYAHDGTDPVGLWYEAALPGRNAFCMRDVAHQAGGAAALGLDDANLNMLRRFAAAVAPERDWAGYWEIDVTGNPAPIDYVSDQDFWYNLPANFDVLDAVFRVWLWTGDDTYVTDPKFKRFFATTSKEYVAAWQLQPGQVLSRPRIMNRHLANGRSIDHRGIPGYEEGQGTFTLGVDLLAAEYRAFLDLAYLAERDDDTQRRKAHLQTALEISELIEKYAWSSEERHYVGLLSSEGAGQSSGDLFLLHFSATRDSVRIREALDYLKSPAYLERINIELESYLPKIFFTYGQSAAAYRRILAISDQARERREYPEVSFAVVDAVVSGVMGINIPPATGQSGPTIQTMSHLVQKEERATISGIHIQGGLVDVTHLGRHSTTFANRTDKTLCWQASFNGHHDELLVNGYTARATIDGSEGSQQTSSISVNIMPGSTMTVSLK
jgi:hypothetical protein